MVDWRNVVPTEEEQAKRDRVVDTLTNPPNMHQREDILVTVVMAERYERPIRVNEVALKPVLLDNRDRRVRVIASHYLPFRVWESESRIADVVVFARPLPGRYYYWGWLEMERIAEAPIWEWEKDGKVAGFAWEIDFNYVRPMPETFDFSGNCHHPLSQWTPHDSWKCLLPECGVEHHDAFWRKYEQRRREERGAGSRGDGDGADPAEGETRVNGVVRSDGQREGWSQSELREQG